MPSGTTINTILQCFVDLNLETNENATFSLDLLDVSFAQSAYTVDEGQIVEVDVSLSAPSVEGYEEVEVGIVANNTSLSDINNLGEVYPRTLTFSAGQQTHTLRFLANSDFIEEATESFDLILGFFTNTDPGQYITSTVNIVDLTDLKEVFINDQGGNYQISTITSASTLTFSALEGTSKQVKVSLDSPSVFGIEGVTVNFVNNTTSGSDYSIVGSTNLSWAVGEQDKTFTIQAIDDGLIEDTEILEIFLSNPVFTNLDNPSNAEFKIFNNSPESRYINVNLQGIYTQIGGFNFQNFATLRHVNNGEELSVSSADETMLLKFGHSAYTINPPSNSPAFDCGDNCIQTVVTTPFQGTTTTNTVFFGYNPSTKKYGDVRLKVISQGSHPVIIDGNQVNPGQSATFVVDSFDYNITLPANDVLVSGGTIIAGDILSADTLSEGFYEFIIESDYAEREVVLQDIDNSDAVNKEVHLGLHRFEETYNLATATATTNQHNLVTTYNQVAANWDNYPNYNSPQTCVPLNAYVNNNWSFPSNDGEMISVANGVGHARIDGIALLSDNSIHYGPSGVGHGPSGNDESTYVGVEFLPSGQTIGITCAPISFPGTQTSIGWTSLAFEIIP